MSIVPRKANDKLEDWRTWREDTADFFDTQLEGIGEFLTNVVGKHEGSKEELTAQVEQYVNKYGQKIDNEVSTPAN